MIGTTGRRQLAAATVAVTLAAVSCAGGDDGGDRDRGEETAPSAPGDARTCASPGQHGQERTLFDGTRQSLDSWRMAGPGEFELQDDGSMVTRGGMGLLWYPEEFGAYRLVLEWKVAGDDNSGVFIGFPEPGDDPRVAVDDGYEVQIDATDEPDRTTGAIYAVQEPDAEARDAALNPPGSWNEYEITVHGSVIDVVLNGVTINRFQAPASDADVTPGHVGLQNHGPNDEVYYRDVRIHPC